METIDADSVLKRWKDSSPNAGLTWGIKVDGDAFIELAIKYNIFGQEKAILELGPGYGRILDSILSKGIQFKGYLGIDISKANVEYLQSKFANSHDDINFVSSDFATIELDKNYDIVLSSLTFKHQYPTFEQALGNICKYLSKDAILFFDLIENSDADPETTQMPAKTKWYRDNVYVAYYTKAEVLQILNKLSLELVAFDNVIHHESKASRLVVIAKQVEEGNGAIAVIHKQYNLFKNLNNELMDKLESLNKGLTEKNTRIQQLETHLNSVQREAELKQEKIELLKLELKELKKQLEEGKAAIEKQNNFLKTLNSELTTLKSQGSASVTLTPQSLPNKRPASLYTRWYALRFTEENISGMLAEISQFKLKPKISIIMPVYKTPSRWLIAAIESVKNQLYGNWELCICDDDSKDSELEKTLTSFAKEDSRIHVVFSKQNEGIAGASNRALKIATGDYVALVDHDDEISRDALFEVVKTINNNPGVDYIYSDEDKLTEEGEHTEAFFKPDWSPDLFLSTNYLCHLSVMRKSLINSVRGFRKGFDGSQDYDLLLRITEKASRIAHIPMILYHWRKIAGSTSASHKAKPKAHNAGARALNDALKRRGIDARVADGDDGYYRVKYKLSKRPLVSIIILNKDNAELLRRCIESITNKTTYRNYEIIILDHNSTDQATLDYLKTLKHKVIKYEGKFNYSLMNNIAAKSAKGKHFIFLNNDTEVIEPSWIEAMLEHSQRKEVGAVGAKLFFPDNSVQHAGIIVGFNNAATSYETPTNERGYFSLGSVIRNCSAVTAACIMIRKEVFESVGGFDEEMAHSWQDVDLCLRILKSGKRIIYTPYSTLYHLVGGTRGRIDISPEEKTALGYFRLKHRELIENGDPYYNRNLSLLGVPFVPDFTFITDPLDMLLTIYDSRPDLQTAFPETRSGSYDRLIQWAAQHGIKTDSAKIYLTKFAEYYEENANRQIPNN